MLMGLSFLGGGGGAQSTLWEALDYTCFSNCLLHTTHYILPILHTKGTIGMQSVHRHMAGYPECINKRLAGFWL